MKRRIGVALLAAAAGCDRAAPPADPGSIAAAEDAARQRAIAAEMTRIDAMRADVLRNAAPADVDEDMDPNGEESGNLLDVETASADAIDEPGPPPIPPPADEAALHGAEDAVREAMERRRAGR